MTHTEFLVEGMTCGHCVKTVSDALERVNGVSRVAVNLESKEAQVDYDETQATEEDLFDAILAQDYQPIKKN